MDNYSVRITARQARIARKHGDNKNLSDGVRKALEALDAACVGIGTTPHKDIDK